MENATEALIMAASVLLLIMALSVSISSFTSLKAQVDGIIQERESIDLAKDESGNYINYIEGVDDIRTVGVETVISSIRRVRRESYTVYIYGGNVVSAVNSDSDLKGLITQTTRTQYYNNNGSRIQILPANKDIIKISIDGSDYKNISDDVIKKLNDIMKDKKFKEYLGIYQEKTAENVSSANKQTFRVITFVEEI